MKLTRYLEENVPDDDQTMTDSGSEAIFNHGFRDGPKVEKKNEDFSKQCSHESMLASNMPRE